MHEFDDDARFDKKTYAFDNIVTVHWLSPIQLLVSRKLCVSVSVRANVPIDVLAGMINVSVLPPGTKTPFGWRTTTPYRSKPQPGSPT
jgi:hypothetical protein